MEHITPTTINKNQKNMEFIELLKLKNIRFIKDGDRIIVFDDVNLSYSEFKEFPSCPMIFFGGVDLSYTQIEELPNCPIRFCHSLNLSHTPLKELPDYSMELGGYLDLRHTQIKELPDRIVCCYLDINGTSITKIPKDLIAYRICTPYKGELDIYIEKSGKIGIDYEKKRLEEWEEFFKERKPFDNNPDLTHEDYDVVEQDFKTAVKLLKTWRS